MKVLYDIVYDKMHPNRCVLDMFTPNEGDIGDVSIPIVVVVHESKRSARHLIHALCIGGFIVVTPKYGPDRISIGDVVGIAMYTILIACALIINAYRLGRVTHLAILITVIHLVAVTIYIRSCKPGVIMNQLDDIARVLLWCQDTLPHRQINLMGHSYGSKLVAMICTYPGILRSKRLSLEYVASAVCVSEHIPDPSNNDVTGYNSLMTGMYIPPLMLVRTYVSHRCLAYFQTCEKEKKATAVAWVVSGTNYFNVPACWKCSHTRVKHHIVEFFQTHNPC